MNGYSFYPQHLHLHTCFEPGASMEGHMYHASKLGMKYIWFTDHDIRMGRKPIEFDRFFFRSGLTELDEESEPRGFKSTERNCGSVEYYSEADGGAMKLSVNSNGQEWTMAEAMLFSNGKSHCSSLLSDVMVSFRYKLCTPENNDVRLIFDFKLSERPPEGEVAHILYVAGPTDGLSAPLVAVKSIEAFSDWHTRDFYLSNDTEEKIGGLDNTFDTVTVRLEARNGSSAVAYVGDYVKKTKNSYNATRENQKRIADELGKKYGVTPFVATEISCAGMHKNLFSTTIPIIDYDKRDFSVTHEEACRYAVERGGVFSLNHPLSKFKRVDLSTVDIDLEVEKLGRYFADNACFGAKLIEVGFPFGRYLPLSQHLRLWDMLSLEGHFLTGYGCNDAHSIKSGWYSGGNFAGFFAIKNGVVPTEDDIVEAMRAGRAYTADPVKVTGNISFATDSGIPMGAVVSLYAEQTHRVAFRTDALKSGMKIRWIVNGNVAGEKLVDADSISDEIEIASSLAVNFARVELYNDDGQLILLTNPIYFVREDLSDIEIPKERRY